MIDTELHPHTEHIVRLVLQGKPMHRRFLKRALLGLNDTENQYVERYIEFMLGEGQTHADLARAYITIVNDTFVEELYFRENGRYRFSTFVEAQEAVYDNPAYMRDYMIGLALSSFWWANHTRMRRFFQEQLRHLRELKGLYREVGPGHGMYFLEAMRECNFAAYEAIDISATSIDMTRRIAESGFFGRFDRARFIQADFLAPRSTERAAALVMGEVLEHVEQPHAFLECAFQTLRDDGILFLTTCINAPAVDHLYNPGTVQALEDLFAESGFAIRDRCLVGRDDLPVETCEAQRLALNVAYVLAKPR